MALVGVAKFDLTGHNDLESMLDLSVRMFPLRIEGSSTSLSQRSSASS